ncbi:MAG: permease-like cell division protein FtsX [Chitinophagaceae bacterium]|nr:permease-like cell division protein FtsX [Chitinophagaceae bacterium]
MTKSRKFSIRRGRPSYFMAILGVTLVLFLLGIIGWLMINAKKLGEYFKENVEVRAYLRGDLNARDSAALMQYISSKPYTRSIRYVSKEEARKIFMQEENEDWSKVLDENPLPNAIYFRIKRQYVQLDSLSNIKKDLEQQTYVSDVRYPEVLVGKLNKNLKIIGGILLALVVLVSIVVIILIDNTIRLAMFSNRFLIKTMQMVGATRGFIARPLNQRAMINGAISGILASAALYAIILILQGIVDGLRTIHDGRLLLILFLILIFLGILITYYSTNRSVLKYLKMKLDDLY